MKLIRQLGHGDVADGAAAIERLSKLSIVPGTGPGAQWQPDAAATTKFVAEIQASVQLMLKRVATELAISPPPTLELYIFQVAPAPQKIFFPAEDQPAPARPASGEGITGEASLQAPGTLGKPSFPPPSMVAAPPPPPASASSSSAVARVPPPPAETPAPAPPVK